MPPSDATPAVLPPLPQPDALTTFFWDGVAQHKLLILCCQTCGHLVHYPRPLCDRCQGRDLTPTEVSGRATISSYTVVEQAFHPYFVDKLPYVLAVVELEEEAGVRLTTNIVDCTEDRLHIDLPVVVDFREVAPGFTLPMFRPA